MSELNWWVSDSPEWIRLKNITLWQIDKSDGQYLGGNQDWYPYAYQRSAGCGPTAATNIIVYLSQTVPGEEALFEGRKGHLGDYRQLMETLYDYVRPIHLPFYRLRGRKVIAHWLPLALGVPCRRRFSRGVLAYAEQRKVDLKERVYNYPLFKSREIVSQSIFDYLKMALSEERPVALLNRFKKIPMVYWPVGRWQTKTATAGQLVDYHLHWVTVIGLKPAEPIGRSQIEVLTWGGLANLRLADLAKSQPVMVYFE